MHPKLARDPFLGPLAAERGQQVAWDAGFFLDTDPTDAPLDDVDWLCTPLPERRALGPRPIALLATGGFCPVHVGHLRMLAAARAAASAAGYDVVAGYLAPDHDQYVRQKCGDAATPASVRLGQCADAAEGSGWLLVDPWPALHRRGAVNYTDVVARLRRYLRVHHDPHIDVFYVCGGDNARFASAFERDAGIVVVARPGSEAEYERMRRQLPGRANILFCDAHEDISSRELRAGAYRDVSERRVLLRLEDERAAGAVPLGEWRRFQSALLSEFERFAAVRWVGTLPAAASGAGVISLDAMLPAAHTLALSRLFALGGYQALGHVPRPGSPPLAEQLAALPSGDYVLLDDDRASGSTLRAALAALPARIRVQRTELAIAPQPGEEVVDSRDFLLGAAGGLVTRLPRGAVGRAPYLLPYVDPSARCNVPPPLAREFSQRLWRLNALIHARTGLTIEELPDAARPTLSQFAPERSLASVAEWHAERLEDAAGG